MWLVVHKEGYYPSVFECETEEEAIELYNKIVANRLDYCGGEEDVDGRTYLAKVEKCSGELKGHVNWSSVNIREECK